MYIWMGGWIRNWRAKFKVHQTGLSRYLVVSKHSQNTNCRSRKDLSVPYQLCTVIHSVYFLNRARWWTFCKYLSWVGGMGAINRYTSLGYGTLHNLVYSGQTITPTSWLFLLSTSVNISLSDGKDEMLKIVFVSCLNEHIELDGDEYM